MFEFENHHPEEVFLGQEGHEPLPCGAPHTAPGPFGLSQGAGA